MFPIRRGDANARTSLGYTEEPIVSSDVIGNPHSAVIDALATLLLNKGLVKSIIWYDNGWAYATRVLELAKRMAGLIAPARKVRGSR